MQRAIDGINELLRGDASDLAAVPLDMTGVPPFHRRVYETVRTIPPGASLSYGEVAAKAEAPGAARAVGQAMRRNPFSILVPCHRVFAAGGKIGGYSAHGGLATKLRLLSLEAAAAEGAAALFEGDGVLPFDPAFALDYLRDADPVLGRLIDTIGPFRMQIRRAPSIFIALAEAIVYQQLHGKAAASIFARVRALYPRRMKRRPRRRSSGPATPSCAAPACRNRNCSRCAIWRGAMRRARSRLSPRSIAWMTRRSSRS